MNGSRIGNFIQKCRKEKGFTQEELGEILGVSGKSISRWENNITMPDVSLITTIADVLEVEVSELLNGQKTNKREIIESRNTIDQVIEYSNYESKNKIKRFNILLFVQIFVILIAVINNIIAIYVIKTYPGYYIIDISLHIIALGISFIRIHENKREHEFKVNVETISDTDNKH